MAAKAFGPPTSTPTASAGAGPSNAAATGAGASGRPGTPAPVQVASAPSPGAAAAPGVGGGGSTTHASQPQQPPTTMPAYDPTSALASINHKIALLEEQTQGFVEINARTADEARRRVRGVPTEELEGQYIDLVRSRLVSKRLTRMLMPLLSLAVSRDEAPGAQPPQGAKSAPSRKGAFWTGADPSPDPA